jgi:hypothetical protein
MIASAAADLYTLNLSKHFFAGNFKYSYCILPLTKPQGNVYLLNALYSFSNQEYTVFIKKNICFV